MKSDLVVCGSTRHDFHGCEELHVACRQKTREKWRRQKALEEELAENKKTLTATA